MTEDMKAKIKQLADDYAHCYAFVGDDTMPLKRTELHAAIDSIDARGEAVAPALRVLFEEWAERDEYPLHKRQNGEYSYPPTQSAWRIWQAAAGAAALRYAAPLCASQDGVGEQQGGPYAIHRDAIADHGSLQEKVAEESFPDALRSPLPGRESTAQSAFAGATRLALSDDMTYDRDGNLVAADDTESESTAQAGIAQSFGPVINPPTVLTTTAGVDTRTVCGTAQAGAGDPRCSDCPARWPGSKWAAAPTVLAMREALQTAEPFLRVLGLDSAPAASVAEQCRAALASPLPEPRAGITVSEFVDLAIKHGVATKEALDWTLTCKLIAFVKAASPEPRAGEAWRWALLQASIDAVGKRMSGDAYLKTRAELLADSHIPTPEPQEGRDHAV